jgi:DNA-binding MarR family transcriptional regulator
VVGHIHHERIALYKATCGKADLDEQITAADSASMKVIEDHIDTVVADWKRERPDYDLAPVEIIGRAGRIMEYVDRALEAKFQEFGITRATFDVLATLRRGGRPYRMPQRDLMRRLLRTSGSMSLRIDALEREGLVSRLPDKEDRRSVFVALAPKGLSLIEKVIPEHLTNETTLLTGLSKADCDELKALLRKWLISLEANVSQGSQLQLGIMFLDPHTSLTKRRAVGLPDVPGILVHHVEPGSWAEDQGFRKGDLIYAIQGRSVRSIADLRSILNKSKPRAKRFKVMRGSDSIEI